MRDEFLDELEYLIAEASKLRRLYLLNIGDENSPHSFPKSTLDTQQELRQELKDELREKWKSQFRSELYREIEDVRAEVWAELREDVRRELLVDFEEEEEEEELAVPLPTVLEERQASPIETEYVVENTVEDASAILPEPEPKRRNSDTIGAYIYVWFDGDKPIYVGMSAATAFPYDRHTSHKHNENAEALRKAAEDNKTFSIRLYDNLTDRGARLAESALIYILRPSGNIQIPITSRPSSMGELVLASWEPTVRVDPPSRGVEDVVGQNQGATPSNGGENCPTELT